MRLAGWERATKKPTNKLARLVRQPAKPAGRRAGRQPGLLKPLMFSDAEPTVGTLLKRCRPILANNESFAHNAALAGWLDGLLAHTSAFLCS